MTIIAIVFLLLGLFLSIKKPRYFVIYYILASTKFLGFIDPSSFIIGGVEIGYFGLNLITILSIFFNDKWYSFPKNTRLFAYTIIVILIYGILKPVFDENSTLIKAIIASKEIWFYSIFFYLVVYRQAIDDLLLSKSLKMIGVFLSVIYIVGLVIPEFVPPLYYNGAFVRTFYPTYISLALFLYCIDLKFSSSRSFKDRGIVVVLLLGLLLAGHSSLIIMTVFGFVLYKYLYNKNLILDRFSIVGTIAILSFSLLFILVFVDDLYDDLLNTIDGIITGKDNSLSARDIYNKFRWEAINKKKEIGYGFIHQSSDFMKEINTINTNRFMERFTVIDSGYVDMIIKYGYIGTIGILLVFTKNFAQGFMKKYRNPLSLAMSVYLLQYVFINYTWSVYTFAHGIIPGMIALYFLLVSQNFYSKNDLNKL